MVGDLRDQIFECPRARRLHVLGVTSLWLLLPVSVSRETCACARPEARLLSGWVVVVCAVSTARYWLLGVGSLRPGVWRQGFAVGKCVFVADQVCAALLFSGLVAFFALDNGEHRVPRWITLAALPAAVGLFFAASRHCELARDSPVAAMACHLVFRYLGFWWVYLALAPPDGGIAIQLAVNSTLYWGHIAYSVALPGEERGCFGTAYVRGCAEVLAAVAAALLFVAVFLK